MRMRARANESINKDVKQTLPRWCGALLIPILARSEVGRWAARQRHLNSSYVFWHRIVHSHCTTICRYFFNIAPSCIPQLLSYTTLHCVFTGFLVSTFDLRNSMSSASWEMESREHPAPSGQSSSSLRMAEIQEVPVPLTRDAAADAPIETTILVWNNCINQKW